MQVRLGVLYEEQAGDRDVQRNVGQRTVTDAVLVRPSGRCDSPGCPASQGALVRTAPQRCRTMPHLRTGGVF